MGWGDEVLSTPGYDRMTVAEKQRLNQQVQRRREHNDDVNRRIAALEAAVKDLEGQHGGGGTSGGPRGGSRRGAGRPVEDPGGA
jgi:hypothetical protein